MSRARRRVGLTLVVSLLVFAPIWTPTPASGANSWTCGPGVPKPLDLKLRDVTVNQGLGSYPKLARGKQTMVRLYLSLPNTAATDASIAVTGATLSVNNGSTGFTIGAPFSPAAGTNPLVARYENAPHPDTAADPKFVLPPNFTQPTSTDDQFTLTLSATVNVSVKTSAGAAPVACTFSFTGKSATPATPITATVEKKTNALRILVVPMGDATQSYATWFDDAARSATQKGMKTLARVLPVPDGTADLSVASGGLRYSIAPTLLDVRSALHAATGKFCGTASNFVTLKPLLAQFLLSWNTANPTKTADRVLGVVAGSKSLGGASSCNEGYAAVNSNVGWVRAIPDAPGAPSTTGALMAMELGHTMGVVPTTRDDDFSVRHSAAPNGVADGTAPQRAYNLSSRAYLSDNHTVMKLSGTWNQVNTVFEPLDWAYLLCIMGGATADQCTTPGAVGTSTGVGAGSTFVISGTSDSTHTMAGTRVVESYFKQDVAQTPPDPTSPYRLVRRSGPPANTILETVGVPFTHDDSNHGTSAGTITDLFAAALAFDDTSTQKIELWYGNPPGGALLYTRTRTGAPTLGGVAVGVPGVGTEQVSVAGTGNPGDFGSGNAVITPDGRYVAFDSFALNLVPKNNDGIIDVFVRDRQAETTVRVSLGPDPDFAANVEGNGHSRVASISDNGRFVAFESDASNFNEIDNGVRDVYVHDRDADGNGTFDETNDQFGTSTSRVSVDSGGIPGNGTSSAAAISADGNIVAFESLADNLDAFGSPDGGGTPDVFVHDRVTGFTERVSIDSTGPEADGGNGPSQAPAISGDGRYVAFESDANNLMGPGNDTNGFRDVFRRDRFSGSTGRMSVNGAGNPGNGTSRAASITADGNFVAFSSLASNLVASDTNAVEDVFRRDPQASATERVSVTNVGVQGNAESQGPDISDDGRFVAFDSKATNLAPGDSNGSGNNHDVFVHDRTKDETRRLSVGSADSEAVGGSAGASITGDGRVVAFLSDASNLVGGDTNGTGDVFIRDLPPGEQPVDVIATDDNPQDLVLDLFFTCPDGSKYPVAVAVPPIDAPETTASFETNFDPSVACAGGSLSATVSDGFTESAPTAPAAAVSSSKPPTAAIETPVVDQNLPFRSALALSGSGKDPEDDELGGSSLQWSLTSPGQLPASVGTGATVDVPAPTGGWPAGDYVVTLAATDSDATTVTTSTVVHVTHPLALSPKPVNLINSKPAGCSPNYGPACTTPNTVDVSAPNFGGNPGASVAVLLCNLQAAGRPNADSSGADNDLVGGCDYGGGQGLAPAGVTSSGTLNLDANGNLPGPVTLTLPSTPTLRALGGAPSSNPHAVCPPTAAQINAGWTCVVTIAEYGSPGYPAHAGVTPAYLKSPIPVMTCNGGTCPASIPTGTIINLSGVQFPCRTNVADDPTTVAYDGFCAEAWTNKTILLKRVSTQLIEGPAIVPTSQTAGINGSYTITFPMPAAAAPGDTYKVVPHAPTCSLPCTSGTANAAGKFFRHA